MKRIITTVLLACGVASHPLLAANNAELLREIKRLQTETSALQKQVTGMQRQIAVNKKVVSHKGRVLKSKPVAKPLMQKGDTCPVPAQEYHKSLVSVHVPSKLDTPPRYYPTALIADGKIVTYIAGTPVVTSPYTGDRPAFDGSDYIVNISSINRDLRLMEQRRSFYHAYEDIGYPPPRVPIIAISGKAEPVAVIKDPFFRRTVTDISLGSSELDVAAALNHTVEAFFSVAYDDSAPTVGGPRVSNSNFTLNLGFVNVGDLDRTPFYFTAGQLFVPFGRYASAMISSPITLALARTKTRPFIVGYKSQESSGPYAALYTYVSDTRIDNSRIIPGFNLGYTIGSSQLHGDLGAGIIGTIADAGGMQLTGSAPFTTFGGFGSATNGNEAVGQVPAANVHANIGFSRYNFTAEWVGATQAFNPLDLSYNGNGARPQAGQLEAGVTFRVCNKPASLAAGYQWSSNALALNLPKNRATAVFNISIWKDTIESLEYRHDTDYGIYTFANGINAPGAINADTFGTGRGADTIVAQIGVYF